MEELTDQMKHILGSRGMAEMRKRDAKPQTVGRARTGTPMSGEDDPRHGTLGGYQNVGCRCQLCRDANADSRYRWKYGMPKAGKEAMLESQGGVCASCGVDDPGTTKGWHIDHDHTTGRVRSILCHACNVSYGLFKEDLSRIEGFVEYARKHQTAGF